MLKKRFGWVFLFLFSLAVSLQAQINLLHSFAGGASDGEYANGSLILKGSTLYGMTYNGGTSNYGTIFKINTNGTGFVLLHSFTGSAEDGSTPYGSLILKGSTLYGMTYNGGTSNYGTIFKINTNGTGFVLLHSFTGSAEDGSSPYGSLILKGSALYGMTFYGGTTGWGTIFKINTNGTGFALLHTFIGPTSDGGCPFGSLIRKGSTLYGMTQWGGSSNWGTIFKINTNGTGFVVLHSFAGGASDGIHPSGELILKGSALYGMSAGGIGGGTDYEGTIFKINTNGTGYALLHTFIGGASDGRYPFGSLILKGSTLYGMTQNGGTSNSGTIFTIKTIGTGFELIHSFAGGASDGAHPDGSLILKGSALYGMTVEGGASNYGIIFSYSLK